MCPGRSYWVAWMSLVVGRFHCLLTALFEAWRSLCSSASNGDLAAELGQEGRLLLGLLGRGLDFGHTSLTWPVEWQPVHLRDSGSVGHSFMRWPNTSHLKQPMETGRSCLGAACARSEWLFLWAHFTLAMPFLLQSFFSCSLEMLS